MFSHIWLTWGPLPVSSPFSRFLFDNITFSLNGMFLFILYDMIIWVVLFIQQSTVWIIIISSSLLAQLINGNVMSGHNRETGKEPSLTWRVTTRSSPNFSCTWIHLSICHPDRLLAPRFRTLPHLTRSFRVRNVSSRGTATSQMWVCENLHKKFDTFLIAHIVPF